MASELTPWLPLGELLVERRLLSRRQLELALQEHQRTGRRLGEVLVSYGFVSEQALASTLLEQVGLMDAKPVAAEPPEPEPLLRAANHLAEAQPDGAVVLRVEDMLLQPAPGHTASALEEKVVEFEQRSDQIQASIAEIRDVLGELQA
ncbi:MAG: type pilus assembly protein PilB [Gaiellaceae bacterium]|jgi:beta-phosphoglucomutase-like phosphatase (HAD superfamily)|nr:type pilus assembly protein PilB [Gaiellaceae bacterium]